MESMESDNNQLRREASPSCAPAAIGGSSGSSIVCSYCEAPFPSRSQLFKHLRAKHDLDQQQEQEVMMRRQDDDDDDDDDDEESSSFGISRRKNNNLTPTQRTAASHAVRGLYHNAAHDAYYKAQIITEADGEYNFCTLQDWEEAQHYFRRPLPVAFRMMMLPSSKKKNLQQQQQQQDNNDDDDIRHAFIERLRQLLPDNSLRSCPSLDPEMAQTTIVPPRQWSLAAQQALADAQEVGAAHRQELCSMIPPLLLLHEEEGGGRGGDDGLPTAAGRRQGHVTAVLDLCAAPGSKSLQLLDQLFLQQQQQQNQQQPYMLVCNDSNRQRLMTVIHRSRRSSARGRPPLVLNCSDGRYFPALCMAGGFKVKFDRVLADVPCSGDGTLRKMSGREWQKWNVQSHLHLHTLQVRLLTRALECTKKGGRVVYSTCSLDPVEDEAVVVSAIARRGGPSVYRICPLPERLYRGATEGLPHARGARQWVVPHPQFGKIPKKDNEPATTYETYQSIDQVPVAHRKKDIRPSMFPPRARTEAALARVLDNDPEKLVLARKFGEILSERDVELFEEMLPNCARIFPQHLDSGGFFCAVIERVAPAFYPVCYPLERQRREKEGPDDRGGTVGLARNVEAEIEKQERWAESHQTEMYRYHGRILTNVQSTQHLREFLVDDKARGDEVIYEGVATRDLGLKWLREKRAFIPGISEQVLEMPVCEEKDDDSDNCNGKEDCNAKADIKQRKRHVNDPTKSSIYTRLFPQPHPALVEEFCDFFGFLTCPRKASEAGVEVFPAERLVVMGGGDGAVNVTSCLDPDEAHTLVPWDSDGAKDLSISGKRRFFHLVLVSEQVRNLFKGGAKFSPMEVGLSLCWVPVPGKYREYRFTSQTKKGNQQKDQTDANDRNKEATRFEDSTTRAAQSGRYGLLDEAAECLGRCATKRIVRLSQSDALQLLDSGFLSAQLPGDMYKWSLGAVIAAAKCGFRNKDRENEPTLFMPCFLKKTDTGGRVLSLVAELRLTDCWKRLLEASLPNS